MDAFQTPLGEAFVVERRLPRVGWRPRLRGKTAGISDLVTPDDLGSDILSAICVAISAIVFLLVAIPLLLLVAEVALVVALIVPTTVLALVLGIKRHTVVLLRVADDRVVETRRVRGVLGSWRAGRALRAAALSGAYRLQPGRRAPTAPLRRPAE